MSLFKSNRPNSLKPWNPETGPQISLETDPRKTKKKPNTTLGCIKTAVLISVGSVLGRFIYSTQPSSTENKENNSLHEGIDSIIPRDTATLKLFDALQHGKGPKEE